MPRPRRRRNVSFEPEITYFKPAGVELRNLEEINLTFDELEAIRLKDKEDLTQEEAAEKMNISQPTFHRLLSSAREKIANFLVDGNSLRIEGGDYKMVGPGRGKGLGRGGQGQGRGRMGGQFSAGPGGSCVCPSCGKKVSHVAGQPCYKIKCPKCGTQMVRER
ncbi:MAG: DUF134 domain-containing protein [Candidatus Aenigmarchaeota archaeon]|nr:DUF134 domain-containing protein [Candidatus Aenigmarchaeota archaeon]